MGRAFKGLHHSESAMTFLAKVKNSTVVSKIFCLLEHRPHISNRQDRVAQTALLHQENTWPKVIYSLTIYFTLLILLHYCKILYMLILARPCQTTFGTYYINVALYCC